MDTSHWHGQAHMPTVRRAPIVIAGGDGAYVVTDDGRRLLDATASLWYCNVGHGRVEIAEAVARQMRVLETYHTFGPFTTPPAESLASRLAGLLPFDDARVMFTSGGSDSVDTAAKLVRRYWNVVGRPEKQTIVAREGAYHGLHGFGTSITGIASNREGYGALIDDVIHVPANDAEALRAVVEEHGERIAAFFCEPVIGAGGVIPPAEDYLARAQEICRAGDVLFVVDEVVTGFGRTGRMFASERYGLAPDLMVMAKGLTSGYVPLGAVAVAERVWEPFWAEGSELIFRHGLTYAGHASACVAAEANLDILEREHLVPRVAHLESLLTDALAPLAELDGVREVRGGVGLLAGVELDDPELAARTAYGCVERGVITRAIGRNTLQISPPFTIDEGDIALLADAIGDAVTAPQPV